MRASLSLFSLLCLLLSIACSKADKPKEPAKESSPSSDSAADRESGERDPGKVIGPFRVDLPAAWKEQAVRSQMRVAHWLIPGDGGDAELIVYYFRGGGGSVEANLTRWYQQFQQPDGKPSAEVAKREEKEVRGFAVTIVDVSGRYVAQVRPGAEARHDKPEQRMLAAIVQTSSGPYFFKMVGPASTVAAAKAGFDALIASIAPAG